MNVDSQTFIGPAPGWLQRSGIMIVAVGTVLFLLLAALIKYPDVTASVGFFSSESPPIDHKSDSKGVLDSVFVSNKDFVHEGDRLMLIESTCRLNEIDTIKEFIDKFENSKITSDYLNLKFPSNLYLGEMQQLYVDLEVGFRECFAKLVDHYTNDKIVIYRNQVRNLKEMNTVLERQLSLFEREHKLAKVDHMRNQSLKSASVISDLDMEKADRELIALEKRLGTIATAKIENLIREQNLELDIMALEHQRDDDFRNNLLKVKGFVTHLKQSIRNWENKYVVSAKITGQVLLSPILTKKIKLNEDDYVASIIPENGSSTRYIRALAPGEGIGKLKVNAKAIIRIDGYPYRQFGTVISRVTSIGAIPKEDKNGSLFYDIRIELPEEIVTTYNVKIPFRPNTRVVAEIVNDDQSVLRRIFNGFLSLLDKN